MLVLSRKPMESFLIGGTRVTVISVRGDKVRISIDAPNNVRVLRCELLHKVSEHSPSQPVPELVQS